MESRTQALGALAQAAGIIIGTKVATLERFRMLKSEISAQITALQATTEGSGLALYLADGDLSLVEIEEQIENDGPLGPNDRVAANVAERPVFLVGQAGNAGGNETVIRDKVSNAPVCMTKPRWTFARTKSWNWVIYNKGTVLTTGSTVFLTVKNFGVWVT